jgi:alanine-glyoxylate transaminase / serine-glyoxylate transaminase / serine-pyruvate transaminase
MTFATGRHFLQIPGPTNVPERVLRAIDRPTIDHRSAQFALLARECLDGLKAIFKTQQPIVIYPASGTGAWEAALVNTLSPGDAVLMYETGHFAATWKKLAEALGLRAHFIADDWRSGVRADVIEAQLAGDPAHSIKAVCVVHNETATGVTSDIAAVRRAIDRARHPALLMVDTISSLASIDYRADEWGVDVTVAGSQKGLMLPPGLSFNSVSERALAASKTSTLPKSYFRWAEILETNKSGFFPYTPATNLLYGLREALAMLQEEGLENVFARHARHAEATRRAVRGWGLELWARNAAEYSNALTAALMPEGHDERELRRVILDQFDMSLGSGLGKIAGKVFRIGHLGHFNDLMLCAALAGVEMGLDAARVPHQAGGVQAAMSYLSDAGDVGASETSTARPMRVA